MTNMTKAAQDVLVERERQKAAEGWTPEHDDEHANGSIALAAAAYASGYEWIWPWDGTWWKPKSPRRDLVRAGALILAEIERLDRIEPKQEGVEAGPPGATKSRRHP